MTDLREAAQMALDALEQVQEADTAGATPKMVMEARKLYEPTITALRAALAQPEQEPVAWMHTTATGDVYFRKKPHDKVFNPQPVYTAPPQREWQGLTPEEAREISLANRPYVVDMIAALEARLKEKNI